jgi:hypothetical protein
MGMYDVVKVEPELLPVSKLIRKRILKENVEWQTKDLDNCLANIEITKDGRLTETISEETFDLDYHGIFEFYGNVGNKWYSFLVKYTDGQLVLIIKIKGKPKYIWPPVPLNSYFKDEKAVPK